MPVWYPGVHVTGNDHDKHLDPFEIAEDYKHDLGEHERVIVVEAGEGKQEVYIEYDTDREDYQTEGWHKIGVDAKPDIDHIDVLIEMVDRMDDEELRLVFDFTNDRFTLEKWVTDDD